MSRAEFRNSNDTASSHDFGPAQSVNLFPFNKRRFETSISHGSATNPLVHASLIARWRAAHCGSFAPNEFKRLIEDEVHMARTGLLSIFEALAKGS
jgi:hypothetical protein